MPLCEYKLYDPASKGMIPCGGAAKEIYVSRRSRKFANRRERITLCPTHEAFFRDAAFPILAEYGKELSPPLPPFSGNAPIVGDPFELKTPPPPPRV